MLCKLPVKSILDGCTRFFYFFKKVEGVNWRCNFYLFDVICLKQYLAQSIVLMHVLWTIVTYNLFTLSLCCPWREDNPARQHLTLPWCHTINTWREMCAPCFSGAQFSFDLSASSLIFFLHLARFGHFKDLLLFILLQPVGWVVSTDLLETLTRHDEWVRIPVS